ncbi:MAG: glycosyltransferase family 9 protein [Polyangiaceae bacterium]
MNARRPVLLVLRALGLGDLLTAVPALRALADAFPDHERVLATPGYLAPLALHTQAVSSVIDARPLAPIRWGGAPPEIAVNLHGRGPRSHEVLRALQPDRLIAFANIEARGSCGGPVWRADEHEVARWCRMLSESRIPADPSRLDLAAPAGDPPDAARGATLLHPGAASSARRWPVERWAHVARVLVRRGERVAITGGPDEVHLATELALRAGVPDRAVLAGRTDVLGLVRAVAAADRVVCGDTGVAHLATALGRPSVILFGPTPPAWWGPPEDRPWHRALWAGEVSDPHADRPARGLLAIQARDVLDALTDLPARPASHARTPDLAASARTPEVAGASARTPGFAATSAASLAASEAMMLGLSASHTPRAPEAPR